MKEMESMKRERENRVQANTFIDNSNKNMTDNKVVNADLNIDKTLNVDNNLKPSNSSNNLS